MAAATGAALATEMTESTGTTMSTMSTGAALATGLTGALETPGAPGTEGTGGTGGVGGVGVVLKLRVGRQVFRVTCEAGEAELMHAAAARVAGELERARGQYRAADGERAATMAALRVAFDAAKAAAEAAKKKSAKSAESGGEAVKIRLLSERMRAVLARTGSPQERDGT